MPSTNARETSGNNHIGGKRMTDVRKHHVMITSFDESRLEKGELVAGLTSLDGIPPGIKKGQEFQIKLRA